MGDEKQTMKVEQNSGRTNRTKQKKKEQKEQGSRDALEQRDEAER